MKKRTMIASMLCCLLALPIGTAGAANTPFMDIKASFAEESISYLYQQGMISGKTATSFAPQEKITREHFALLLAKSIGLQPIAPAVPTFADLPKDAAGYGYVESLHKRQWISGVAPSRFGSQNPVTRQDAAVMLYQVMGKETDFSQALSYRDQGQISPYAANAVRYVTSKGLMQGFGGLFQPKKPLTRAESAVIAHRMQEIFMKRAASYYPEGLPREITLKPEETQLIPLHLTDPSHTAVWALDNRSLGSISNQGLFTANKPGQGVLTLNIGVNTYRISITVTNPEEEKNTDASIRL